MCCLGQVIDTPVLAELAWTVAADLKEMGLLGEEVLCFLFCETCFLSGNLLYPLLAK